MGYTTTSVISRDAAPFSDEEKQRIVAQFDRDGYCFLENVLNREELAALRDAMERKYADPRIQADEACSPGAITSTSSRSGPTPAPSTCPTPCSLTARRRATSTACWHCAFRCQRARLRGGFRCSHASSHYDPNQGLRV